jgi:hypothetical protein
VRQVDRSLPVRIAASGASFQPSAVEAPQAADAGGKIFSGLHVPEATLAAFRSDQHDVGQCTQQTHDEAVSPLPDAIRLFDSGMDGIATTPSSRDEVREESRLGEP